MTIVQQIVQLYTVIEQRFIAKSEAKMSSKDTFDDSIDWSIDWSGYDAPKVETKDLEFQCKDSLEDSINAYDDSIDWDAYDAPPIETKDKDTFDDPNDLSSMIDWSGYDAPPIETKDVDPVENIAASNTSRFDYAVNTILPIIKKASGHGRGKCWYTKKVNRADGSIDKYPRYRKQDTYEKRGKKYTKRFDAQNHADYLQKRAAWRKQIDLDVDSFNSHDKKATYKEAFEEDYLNAEDIELKTKKRRTSLFKTWIEPELGKHIVYETTGKQIEEVFKKIKEKANNKKGLKNPPKTISEVHKTLNAFFNYCINDVRRYILKNPITPYVKKWIKKDLDKYLADNTAAFNDNNSINKNQVIMLMNHVVGKAYEIVFMWMAFHGMRSSEALAIRWEDIDFKNNRVHVHQQTARNGEGKIYIKKRTKNLKTRYVPLEPETRALLLKVPENQRKGLVFLKPTGGIDTEDAFHKRVYLKELFELGLIENRDIASPNDSNLRNKHTLRRFYSSWKQMKGDSLADVSAWIGDTISTTLNYYTKQIDSEDNVKETNYSFSSFYEEPEKTQLKLVV